MPAVYPSVSPRTIDLKGTFNALVQWIHNMVLEESAPGLIVGLSGTDSILVYLASVRAFEKLGKSERVLGVHYGPDWPIPDDVFTKFKKDFEYETQEKFLEEYPNYSYFIRTIIPWLKEQAPYSTIEANNGIIDKHESDSLRWGAIFERSLSGADPREVMLEGSNYWVVGTRNSSEQELGTYSSISMGVSVQPIIHLWKSEILELCKYLGVPEIALQKSCEADCNCGRFDLPAQHIKEVDWILMAQKGDLDSSYLEQNIDPNLLKKLTEFVNKQKEDAGFKKKIPYMPPPGMIL